MSRFSIVDSTRTVFFHPKRLLFTARYEQLLKKQRKQIERWSNSQQEIDLTFELPVPATMHVVKEFCGLNLVEKYLEWKIQ
ncbi:unnamed protein product [Arabis nemorensis]|uniref:Uncharacterized protein n=1 Tax=Arabis nemorensis TaxID=586526 RepID=A0A565B9B1_9BRAS|nr:unnamed protein product [Arabis nemorensis]